MTQTTLKTKIATILEARSQSGLAGKIVDGALILLIVLNVASVMLASVESPFITNTKPS